MKSTLPIFKKIEEKIDFNKLKISKFSNCNDFFYGDKINNAFSDVNINTAPNNKAVYVKLRNIETELLKQTNIETYKDIKKNLPKQKNLFVRLFITNPNNFKYNFSKKETKGTDLYFFERGIFAVTKNKAAIIKYLVSENLSFSLKIDIIRNKYKNIFLHGASIDFNNKGIVILGQSRSGKSTLCSLLHQIQECFVLNDDRANLIVKNKELLMLKVPKERIEYRGRQIDKKKKIKNSKLISSIKKFIKNDSVLLNLNLLCILQGHKKGKTLFEFTELKHIKKQIKDHLIGGNENFLKLLPAKVPVLKIKLGEDKKEMKRKFKKLLEKI
jgi:hypothetical protein